MPKLICKVCKSKGRIPNPDFEACMREEEDISCDDCDWTMKNACNKGEMIECWNCHGAGEMKIDGEIWEIEGFIYESTGFQWKYTELLDEDGKPFLKTLTSIPFGTTINFDTIKYLGLDSNSHSIRDMIQEMTNQHIADALISMEIELYNEGMLIASLNLEHNSIVEVDIQESPFKKDKKEE